MTEDEFRHGPTPDPASSLEPAGYFVSYTYTLGDSFENGVASVYPPIWAAQFNEWAKEQNKPDRVVLLNFWPLTRAQADVIMKTGEIEQV